MKKRKLLLMLVLVCIFSMHAQAFELTKKDSTQKIIHTIDGKVSEWNIEKFEKCTETGIFSCVDHDELNVYIAIKIADQPTQMKLTNFGMHLYLDKKGKKKESTGIEFPVKKEGQSGGGRPSGNGTNEQGDKKMDVNALHDQMANSMMLLRTFGFDDQEDKTQIFAMQNGVNIGFDWDESNNLYIEYLIPLTYLGGKNALVGKPLSIGWKINGRPDPSSSNFSNPTLSAPTSSRSRSSSSASSGRSASFAAQSSGLDNNQFKEQNIWTKYTLHF